MCWWCDVAGGTMGRIPEAGGMGPTGADALSALNHYMLQENKGEEEA